MQIQINTDNHIKGHETFTSGLSSDIEHAFSRFSDQITRVELHLSDENGDKSGVNDKKCVVEVRLKQKQPIAVTHQDALLDKAIKGAVEKMKHLIENTLGRQHDQNSRGADASKHYQDIPNE